MRWMLVYDLTSQGLSPDDWIFSLFSLVGVGIGLWIINEGRKWFGSLFIVVSILWTGMQLCFMFNTYAALTRAYRERTYQVAEGFVHNFQTVPCGARGREQFEVNGVHFSYAFAEVKMGFRQTQCQNGPILPNLYVRIWYVDRHTGRHIIRLEIRRGSSAA